jgi:hypothetical protein
MGKETKLIDGNSIRNIWCPFCGEQIINNETTVNSEHNVTVEGNVIIFICTKSQKAVEIIIKIRDAPIW